MNIGFSAAGPTEAVSLPDVAVAMPALPEGVDTPSAGNSALPVFMDVLRLVNVDPQSPTPPGVSVEDGSAEGEDTGTDAPHGLIPEGWAVSLASGSVAVPAMRVVEFPHSGATSGSTGPAVAGVGAELNAPEARPPAGAEPATRGGRADGTSFAASVVTNRVPASVGGELAVTNIERRTAESTAGVAAATHMPAPTVSEPASHADGVLRLVAQAPSHQWRQPLTEALGEHLKLQMARGSEHAVIRLDPPTLGRIEILVRHEGGSLQVQLSASNGEVLRQLSQSGDSLRQDLANRHHGDVSVAVSDGSRDAAGRERSHSHAQRDTDEPGPGRALAEADEGFTSSTFALSKDRE